MSPEFPINRTVLSNRVRVLSEYVPYVDSVSVGVWVQTGSRDEASELKGISHFIEHMMFKGTERRSAKQIADEIDSVGGSLNAFTDKETTWYYAKLLKENLGLGLDIISDMFLHSKFDPEEIEREKNVILEEIKRHEDTPDDMVHDLFTQALWKGHPLGDPITGTRETVESLTQEKILDYLHGRYVPDQVVIAVAGNLEHNKLLDLVSGTLGELIRPTIPQPEPALQKSSEAKLLFKDTEQVHFCVGTQGYSQHDDRKYTLAVLDAMLGGGMSSRLFQEIRENRGLAYSIGSYAVAYKDTGLFTVYGGTSVESLQECMDLTNEEFVKIRTEPVGEEELLRGKNQIRGALVLGQESMSNRMSRLANSELYFGRVIPIEEVIDHIMKVSSDDILAISDELFHPDNLTLAAVGPFGEEEPGAGDQGTGAGE